MMSNFEAKPLEGFPRTELANLMPSDMRVCEVNKELRALWKKIRKANYGQLSEIKRKITINYTNPKILELILAGKREPTLSLLKQFVQVCKSLRVECNIQKLITNKQVKFGSGGNAAKAVMPHKITRELAYLLGALRDGTLSKSGKYEVSFSQKNTKWLKLIRKLLLNVFKPSNKPRLIKYPHNTPRLTLSNRPILEYFHNVCGVPIGEKTRWTTPRIVKLAPKEIKRYYIRGYFDADGLAHHLGFCQVNRKSLEDLKQMLLEFGIKTGKISKRFPKKGKLPIYSFYTSVKSYKQFIKKIGSWNPSKRKPLY